ncbi:hypothetical protein AAZX31_02G085300 [Glycine max]
MQERKWHLTLLCSLVFLSSSFCLPSLMPPLALSYEDICHLIPQKGSHMHLKKIMPTITNEKIGACSLK